MSLIRGQLVGDVVSGSTFAGIVTATVFEGNGNIGILTVVTVSAGGTIGTGAQYLRSTGTGVTWSDISFPEQQQQVGTSRSDSIIIGFNSAGERLDDANGRLPIFGSGNFRVYRSPGTFTVDPGISSIRVRVIGAGSPGSSGGTVFVGGPVQFAQPIPSVGGSGGGYAHKVITSFPAPRTYAVTVGFPGGGTSSFGSEVSATGGTTFGPGGSGFGGDVNFIGARGIGPPGTAPFFGIPSGPTMEGIGGAAATQLGNGSGASVPGIPNVAFPGRGYSVRRFPFDIFEGFNGGPNQDGFEGGHGGDGSPPSSTSPQGRGRAGGVGGGGGRGVGNDSPGIPRSGNPGGAGGIGAGGGSGAPGAVFVNVNNISTGAGGGGPGGPCLVIVEW